MATHAVQLTVRARAPVEELRHFRHGDIERPHEAINKHSVAASAMSASGRVSLRGSHWAAIPLRLIVGYGFMAHGYAKVARGPEHFVGIVHAIGIPAADVMAWATIVVELIGGLAVLLGAFVPWVSMPMAVILLVATFTVHRPNGFSSIKLQAVTAAGPQFGQPGYEADLLYLACLAALVVGGAGPLTVHGMHAKLKARRASIA